MDPNGYDPGGMCQLTKNKYKHTTEANVQLKKDHKIKIKTVREAICGTVKVD